MLYRDQNDFQLPSKAKNAQKKTDAILLAGHEYTRDFIPTILQTTRVYV